MAGQVKAMLQGIERYNPDNTQDLEQYVEVQAKHQGEKLLLPLHYSYNILKYIK